MSDTTPADQPSDPLRTSVADAIARVDAGSWGTETESMHPYWRKVYWMYADAALAALPPAALAVARQILGTTTTEAEPSVADTQPVCGDQYDESVCQLTPGHEGSHADWNRAWDHGRAPTVTAEPCGLWGGCVLPSGHTGAHRHRPATPAVTEEPGR